MTAAMTVAAGVGGAFAVYGSFDDSPGGTLIGVAIVLVAAALNARRAQRVASSSTAA